MCSSSLRKQHNINLQQLFIINILFIATLAQYAGLPVKLELKVGVKSFDHVMEVDLTGGWNLKLKYTEHGLEIKQQVQPF